MGDKPEPARHQGLEGRGGIGIANKHYIRVAEPDSHMPNAFPLTFVSNPTCLTYEGNETAFTSVRNSSLLFESLDIAHFRLQRLPFIVMIIAIILAMRDSQEF